LPAEALKGRVDPVLWQKIDTFIDCVLRWRRNWCYYKQARFTQQSQYRVYAPEPASLLYGNSVAG